MPNWDVVILVAWLAGAAGYAAALTRRWRHADGRGLRRWPVAAFGAGWFVLAIALLSPLATLSDALFAAHMTQHELLMLVSAPLVVIGQPFATLVWLAPARWRRRLRLGTDPRLLAIWRALTAPVVVLLLHGAVLWGWHAPVLFEAALGHEPLHLLQHLMFFWTAALFWWALIHGRYGRLGYGTAVLFVFLTAVHSSLLGALLTFAANPLYPTHAAGAVSHGVPPLDDQQLAGVLMWVPAGTLLTLVGLGLFAAWLGEAERRGRAV